MLKKQLELENEPKEFDYMLLARMQEDCKYYLGYGYRNAGKLWAKSETEQIEKMKEIYNSFPEDKKPEWITMQDIEEFEKQMIPEKSRVITEEKNNMKTNIMIQNNKDLSKLKEALEFQSFHTIEHEPRLQEEDMIYELNYETHIAIVHPAREMLEDSSIEIMSVKKYMDQDFAYKLGKDTDIQMNYTLQSPIVDDMDELGNGIASTSSYHVVLKENDCLLLRPNGEISSIAIAVENDPDCSFKIITDGLNITEYHVNNDTKLHDLINEGKLTHIEKSVFDQILEQQNETLEKQWQEVKRSEYLNTIEDLIANANKDNLKDDLLATYDECCEFENVVYFNNIPNLCVSFIDEPKLYVIKDQSEICEYDPYSKEATEAIRNLEVLEQPISIEDIQNSNEFEMFSHLYEAEISPEMNL